MAPSGVSRYTAEIKFTPKCVLPERTQVSEWLKDQTLSLTRTALDPREVGGPGDSIVLTPAESGEKSTTSALAKTSSKSDLSWQVT